MDSESSKYIASVEKLIVSTDIPIFKKGTVAFTIVNVLNEDAGYVTNDVGDDFEMPEENLAHRQCTVGPVYSFTDFIHQVESWCLTYNRLVANEIVHVDAQLASRKIFGLQGNRDFWALNIIMFSNDIGRVFEGLIGEDGLLHNYLFYDNEDANRTKQPLIGSYGVGQNNLWLEDADEYMYVTSMGALQDWNFGTHTTLAMPCKLDMFENRVGLQIDAVLPLPFEVFVINSNSKERNKGATQYNFMTLDFPEGALKQHTRLGGNSISDNIDIQQQVRTGLFQLVPNSHNSVAKKLMAGSLQSQRYELLLLRKVPQQDGTVKIVPEPVEFTNGDFWSMDVVFTKQI